LGLGCANPAAPAATPLHRTLEQASVFSLIATSQRAPQKVDNPLAAPRVYLGVQFPRFTGGPPCAAAHFFTTPPAASPPSR